MAFFLSQYGLVINDDETTIKEYVANNIKEIKKNTNLPFLRKLTLYVSIHIVVAFVAVNQTICLFLSLFSFSLSKKKKKYLKKAKPEQKRIKRKQTKTVFFFDAPFSEEKDYFKQKKVFNLVEYICISAVYTKEIEKDRLKKRSSWCFYSYLKKLLYRFVSQQNLNLWSLLFINYRAPSYFVLLSFFVLLVQMAIFLTIFNRQAEIESC
ncbi:hypothetical protein RFI_00206 [Reticulomyxa filosa]|uniref:Uncharacterized protein n=1 Tax=Reticulomyxa filosa TaxID=46433 RepID=X6PFN4_RETFI|nr:hypothetical protein RFI_00206 [Reticulomyxa filosa]|eukprot:ETO36859.1 hypothetical protein RFI_00206 [Reticulomyxa filosa]